jgi:two-component system, OmpR family, phosphate regulon response regulator PhoB
MAHMLDTIVIVEDEKQVSDMLTFLFSKHDYKVEHYQSAEHFFALRKPRAHAIYLVDLNLPGLQGTDIVKTIRSVDKISPIFMLSGHKENSDVSAGLKSGADDYLFKPFQPDHLMMKVNNARTKTETILKDMFNVGVRILPEAHTLVFEGVTVNFTPKEFSIFYVLHKKIGQVVSREELMENDFEDLIARNVDVQVFSIRKKIQYVGLEINTIRGRGYRLGLSKPSESST